jgi:hypothetical protein
VKWWTACDLYILWFQALFINGPSNNLSSAVALEDG